MALVPGTNLVIIRKIIHADFSPIYFNGKRTSEISKMTEIRIKQIMLCSNFKRRCGIVPKVVSSTALPQSQKSVAKMTVKRKYLLTFITLIPARRTRESTSRSTRDISTAQQVFFTSDHQSFEVYLRSDTSLGALFMIQQQASAPSYS